jgi:hypothetical protein
VGIAKESAAIPAMTASRDTAQLITLLTRITTSGLDLRASSDPTLVP